MHTYIYAYICSYIHTHIYIQTSIYTLLVTHDPGVLLQVAKAVSQALNNCVGCLPGLREVDQAVKYITTISMKLSHPQQVRHLSIEICCHYGGGADGVLIAQS